MKPSSRIRSVLWMLVWAASFSATMLMNRWIKHIPIAAVLWGRALFSLCFFAPLMTFQARGHHIGLQIFRGVFIAVAMVCSYTVYRNLPISVAGVLGALSPFFCLLFARLLLGEPIKSGHWILAGWAFLGVVIILIQPDDCRISGLNFGQWCGWSRLSDEVLVLMGCLGVLLVAVAARVLPAWRGPWMVGVGLASLVAGVTWMTPERMYVGVSLMGSLAAAMGIIMARMLARRHVPAASTLFFATLVPFVLVSGFIFFTGFGGMSGAQGVLERQVWLWIAVVGACGALSQLAYLQAVKNSPVSFVAPLEYLRLLFLMPAGYVFFGEIPAWTFYPGAALLAWSCMRLAQDD